VAPIQVRGVIHSATPTPANHWSTNKPTNMRSVIEAPKTGPE
jgi:hypothetical protein